MEKTNIIYDYLQFLKSRPGEDVSVERAREWPEDGWWHWLFTNDWFAKENIEIISKFLNIPLNTPVCDVDWCHYYGADTIIPCPIQKIICPNHRWCNTSVKRKLFDAHLCQCNGRIITCLFSGCNQKLNPTNYDEHLEKCEFRIAKCKNKNCAWEGPIKDIDKPHSLIKPDGSNWMPWETEEDKKCPLVTTSALEVLEIEPSMWGLGETRAPSGRRSPLPVDPLAADRNCAVLGAFAMWH